MCPPMHTHSIASEQAGLWSGGMGSSDYRFEWSGASTTATGETKLSDTSLRSRSLDTRESSDSVKEMDSDCDTFLQSPKIIMQTDSKRDKLLFIAHLF